MNVQKIEGVKAPRAPTQPVEVEVQPRQPQQVAARVDTMTFSAEARQLAAAAYPEDPRRFISDEKGPPYLRSGALGPIWVRQRHS